MIINKLSLINFKSHSEKAFQFSPQINCFVGNNGVGKTNVLDALHYLSVGKSFLGNSDLNNIKSNEDFFVIESEIQNEEKEDLIKILMHRESKKVIKKNDKSYDRLADHIGYLPSVMISPYDSNLISDSGESRRKFLDAMISQTDSSYLFDLIQYQKTIQQRNALLKMEEEPDITLLELWEQQMASNGELLYQKRQAFVDELVPLFQQIYQQISGDKEQVRLHYVSHCQRGPLLDVIQRDRFKDRAVGYSLHGVHRDDLEFLLGDYPMKREGSQGQNKTFVIALKLAQFTFLQRTSSNTLPLLLLDDIFDKLDAQRVEAIVKLVAGDHFGQIFITDTNRDHLDKILQNMQGDHTIFYVENGEIMK